MTQTVLIVSAIEGRTRMMADFLIQAGYRTYSANRGSMVTEMVRVEKPVLVILDWWLPDMDGLEVIRQLRAGKEFADVLILLTGLDMGEEDRLKGLEAGADMCMAETLHERLFVARVRSMLKGIYVS